MRSLLLLLAGLGLSINLYAAPTLKIMTEDFAPFSYFDDNGKLTGIGVEIVQTLMQKLDIEQKIDVMPWSRAIKELENNSHRILFCVARTPEREQRFSWVGPLLADGVYLYKQQGTQLDDSNLAAAKQWRSIAVTNNYPEQLYLNQNNFTNLWLTHSPAENARLLIYNRVDAFVAGELVINQLLKNQGYSANIIEKTALKLFDVELYIAFSKNTAPHILNAWQQALDEFKTSPAFQQLRQRYVLP